MSDADLEALVLKPQSATSPTLGSATARPIADILRIQRYLDQKNGTGRTITPTFIVPANGNGESEEE